MQKDPQAIKVHREFKEYRGLRADKDRVVVKQDKSYTYLATDIAYHRNKLARGFKTLVNIRVMPYYLHQLDHAKGTEHFRVSVERGLKLMTALQGNTTGLAIPRYMLDRPDGSGKIQLGYEARD